MAGGLFAYGQEIAKIVGNPTIQEKVGTNIQIQNDGEPSADAQRFHMKYRVVGEKGTANGEFEAVNEGGSWKTKTSTIRFADGSSIDMLTNQVTEGGPANP